MYHTFLLLQKKRSRSVLSTRMKRKRYRNNKKRKCVQSCLSTNCHAKSEQLLDDQSLDAQNDPESTHKEYEPFKKRKYFQKANLLAVTDNQRDSDDIAHIGVESESSCSGQYDVLMDEAKRFREAQEEKKAELNNKFKDFVDHSPCFPDDAVNIQLPPSVRGIDRVEVNHKMKELIHKQKNVMFQAKFFRDRCEQLEQKIRQLKTEKEGVRYFWRNKVLEGECRAGKMLRLAVSQ